MPVEIVPLSNNLVIDLTPVIPTKSTEIIAVALGDIVDINPIPPAAPVDIVPNIPNPPTDISPIPPQTPGSNPLEDLGALGYVASFNTRKGPVLPELGDYPASMITNDSSVPGATVKDALEVLALPPNWIHEEVTLDAYQISTKSVYLANTPSDLESVELQIEGAASMIYGKEFTVTGSTLSWSGTELDGILAVGDVIGIKYIIY